MCIYYGTLHRTEINVYYFSTCVWSYYLATYMLESEQGRYLSQLIYHYHVWEYSIHHITLSCLSLNSFIQNTHNCCYWHDQCIFIYLYFFKVHLSLIYLIAFTSYEKSDRIMLCVQFLDSLKIRWYSQVGILSRAVWNKLRRLINDSKFLKCTYAFS